MARWTDYQLSRLETIFAVIILLVILSAILNRVVYHLTFAEQALVSNVVTNINAALRLTEAEYIASDRHGELQELVGSNPVALISQRPDDYPARLTDRPEHQALLNAGGMRGQMANYVGAFEDPDPDQYSRGSWYFNESEGTLVYLVRNRELFSSSLEGTDRIRFRIVLEYEDRNDNGRYDKTVDRSKGIKLRSLDNYTWLL